MPGNNFASQVAGNTVGYQNNTGVGPAANAPPSLPPVNPYLQYINSMPGVMAAQLNFNNQGNLADDNLRQILQQAIIGYGDGSIASALIKNNPALAHALGGAVDPQTAHLANSNVHSTLAQMLYKQNLSRQATNAAGAAVGDEGGIGSSGQQGFNMNLAAHANSQEGYTALQALQQQLGAANAQNLQVHTNLSDQLQNAYTKAAYQVGHNPSQNPIPYQTPAAAPHPIPLPQPKYPGFAGGAGQTARNAY